MSRLRRHRAGLLALLCAGLAVLALLLAFDARSWGASIRRDDLRFQVEHSHPALWKPATLLPGDPAQRLLGLGDGLAVRRALQLFWFSRVGADPESRQDLPTTRADAQQRLEAMMRSAGRADERSTAANLLGILVVTSPLVVDPEAQTQTLRRATAFFRAAIQIDPTNYDAKMNLELILRLRRPGKSRIGADARGGYGFGRGHGVSQAGTGY